MAQVSDTDTDAAPAPARRRAASRRRRRGLDGVTLTGLPPGRYVARVVPANFRKYTGRGATVTFTVP